MSHSTRQSIIRYFLFLLLIVTWSCGPEPTEHNHLISATQLSAPIEEADSLFTLYRDEWKFDSTEIMTLLTNIESTILQQTAVDSLDLAHIVHTKGRVLYEEGNPAGAVQMYDSALTIRMRYLPESHHAIANGHQNISLCHYRQQDYYTAIQHSLAAAKFPDSLPVDLKGPIHHQLGRCYHLVGDYYNAITYTENAIQTYRSGRDQAEEGKKDSWAYRLGLACNDMAFLQANRLKDPEAALPYLEEALDIFGGLSESSSFYRQLANTYHTTGVAYYQMDKFDPALHFYRRSLNLNQMLPRRSRQISANYNNIGIILKHQGKLEAAKTESFRSLNFIGRNGDVLQYSALYDNLGDINAQQGNTDSALVYYNKAISYLVANFSPTTVADNPAIVPQEIVDKRSALVSLSSKANMLRQKYVDTKDDRWRRLAFDTYLTVDTLVSFMRQDYRSDKSKESLVGITKPFYEQAIELSLELAAEGNPAYYHEQAFEFSEKSKAVVLLEAVRAARAKQLVENELLAQEQLYNGKKAYFEKQYALGVLQGAAATRTTAYLDSIAKYRTLHYDVLAQIDASQPAYRTLNDAIDPVSLDELRNQLLAPDEVLIEYFVGENSNYAFVVSRETLQPIPLSVEVPLDSLVTAINQGIAQRKAKGYAGPALALYRCLFEPVEPLISEGADLLIIPDDILAYVPFEALLTDSVAAADQYHFSDYPYLLNKHRIRYNYSAALLREMTALRQRAKAPKLFAGFAPAFPEGIDTTFVQFSDTLRIGALEWNISEVDAIQDIMEGEVFTERAASIDQLKTYGPEYRILHLSTHGYADRQSGDFSFLVFNGSRPSEYTQLFARDLYALQLNADLVIFSACETNTGQLKTGEGIISMARAFSYAGAASMVTTLWAVDEVVSKELMIAFYQSLSDGKEKVHTLHDIKKAYIQSPKDGLNRNAHPFYWAAYVYIGDTGSI